MSLKKYHYKVEDNENKFHYFTNTKKMNEYFGKISKFYLYSLISPGKDYCNVKTERCKHPKIKNIERIDIPIIKFDYVKPLNNEVLH